MTTDDQLRDELLRDGQRFRPDPDVALDNVVRREVVSRRRRRVTGLAAVLAAAAVIGVVVSRGALPSLARQPGPTTQPTTPGHTRSVNLPQARTGPLAGEWQSAGVPVPQLRKSVRAAGVDAATASHVLGKAGSLVVQMSFGATLRVETWDPARPSRTLSVSEQYLVRALSGHRLELTPLATGESFRAVLGYQRSGDGLHLTLQTMSGRDATAKRKANFAVWTAIALSPVETR
jgi:hypothetical protein